MTKKFRRQLMVCLALLLICLVSGALAEDVPFPAPEMTIGASFTRGDTVTPSVQEIAGADGYEIVIREKGSDEALIWDAFENHTGIAFSTSQLETGDYELAVCAIRLSEEEGEPDEEGAWTRKEFTVQGAAAGTVVLQASQETYAINDGVLLSLYAPGASRTAIYVDDGISFTSEQESTAEWYSGEPGTQTVRGEAYYPDGQRVEAETITVTAVSEGALEGVSILNAPEGSILKGDSYVLSYSGVTNVTDAQQYILNIFDITDGYRLAYHEIRREAGAFTVNTADEGFVAGHVYQVNFTAYVPHRHFSVWRERQGFTLRVPGDESRVALTLNGSSAPQAVSTRSKMEFVVQAAGATMIRMHDNSEDDYNFDFHPDMLDAGGRLQLSWSARNYAQTAVIWAEACFDEDPFREDAAWIVSNAICVNVEAPKGQFPQPEFDAPEDLVYMEEGTIRLSNIPAGAEEVFFGVRPAWDEYGWAADGWANCSYPIEEIIARGGSFSFDTYMLEPGNSYRFYVTYIGSGYTENAGYRWLHISFAEDAPAPPEFSLKKDSLVRGENVEVSVEKADGLSYVYVTMTNTETGHANGRSGSTAMPVIFGTSRLEAGEYEVQVVGYNDHDQPGPASFGRVTIEEPKDGTEWVIDASVPSGGTFTYGERVWSSWYAQGAERICVYWNSGETWAWDGSGIWGWSRLEEDGELEGYAVAIYPDGTTRRSETYTWHQRGNGKILGAKAELPDTVKAGTDVTIPYTAAENSGVEVYYALDLVDGEGRALFYEEHRDLTPFEIPSELFAAGQEYEVVFYAGPEDETAGYYPFEQMASFVVVDDTEPDIHLEIVGVRDGRASVRQGESVTLHVRAQGATAVRLHYGPAGWDDWLNFYGEWDDEEMGWREHGDEIFLERSWVWDRDRVTVIAYACFEDDWGSGDATWVQSNPVFVTLEERTGTLPAPRLSGPDKVSQGELLRIRMSEIPEAAESAWYTIRDMYGNEWDSGDAAWDEEGFFIAGTAWLEPGFYHIDVHYDALGYTNTEGYHFFEVTPRADETRFEASTTTPRKDQTFWVTAQVPGASALELYVDDTESGAWAHNEGDLLEWRGEFYDTDEHTFYLRVLRDGTWSFQTSGPAAPFTVQAYSLGSIAAPEIRILGDTIVEGPAPTILVSGADEGIEWSEIRVYDDETGEQLYYVRPDRDLNGEWALGNSLTLSAGRMYRIEIRSGRSGYEGGYTDLRVVVAEKAGGMTLEINGSEHPDPVSVNTGFTVHVSAPKDSTMVLVINGNDWQELYNIAWHDGQDPADLHATWQHGGENRWYMVAMATSDDFGDAFDWEHMWDYHWNAYSNAVILPVTAVGEAGKLVAVPGKESVARGEYLPVTVTFGEHTQGAWVQIKEANENRDHVEQYDLHVGENLLPTSRLEAGKTYYLHFGAMGEAGYNDHWNDWNEMLRYAFRVEEPGADITFGATVAAPVKDETFFVSAMVPGAEELEMYVDDPDFWPWVHEDSDSFEWRGEMNDTEKHTFYLRVKKGGVWTTILEGPGAPFTLQARSLGTIASPSLRMLTDAIEGGKLQFAVSGADAAIEWSSIRVTDDATGEILFSRDTGVKVNGEWDLGDTVQMYAGQILRIEIFSGIPGFEGGYASLRLVVGKAPEMTLSIQGNTRDAEVTVNRDFPLDIQAPEGSTMVMFYNGNQWLDIYCSLWDSGVDPASIHSSSRFGADGTYVLTARATFDDLGDGFDWGRMEEYHWTAYSNSVTVNVRAEGQAARPEVSLGAVSVPKGDFLPVHVSPSEHASRYVAQIKEANEERSHVTQIDLVPGDNGIPTWDLEAGQTYYLYFGAMGEEGYSDCWIDWNEMLNYAFTVEEPLEQSGDMTFTLGTLTPLLGQQIPFTLSAPGALRLSILEGGNEQQSVDGDEMHGFTWNWHTEAEAQYLEARAEYEDGRVETKRIELQVQTLGTLPDAKVLMPHALPQGLGLTLRIAGDASSDNVHIWAHQGERTLLDNWWGGRGAEVTVWAETTETLLVHIQAYGDPGYIPTDQNVEIEIVEGLPKLTLPSGLSLVESEAFAGDESLVWAVVPGGTIGSRAFADCENLLFVEAGEGVSEIADDAFEGTPGVSLITAPGSYVDRYARDHGLGVIYTN
ncbi:MAG: hypothetical protein IJ083_10545 [Clostridia bacterium]|nr:hypothetical protein [Clostridia bacterium]